ncbi:hypothetical protein BaRGS_00004149, partial [Batillaria attramentaria]
FAEQDAAFLKIHCDTGRRINTSLTGLCPFVIHPPEFTFLTGTTPRWTGFPGPTQRSRDLSNLEPPSHRGYDVLLPVTRFTFGRRNGTQTPVTTP